MTGSRVSFRMKPPEKQNATAAMPTERQDSGSDPVADFQGRGCCGLLDTASGHPNSGAQTPVSEQESVSSGQLTGAENLDPS